MDTYIIARFSLKVKKGMKFMSKPTVIEADNLQIKIYVSRKKFTQKPRSKAVIRINEDIYDELVKLSTETGVSICDLASEMLRFAKDKTAVIERSVGFDGDMTKSTINT
jgi:excinuclease UvrABC ATPase subunit